MLREVIISYSIFLIVLFILLITYRDEEERWTRIFCSVMIVGVLAIGTYESYDIIRLRKKAKEIILRYKITKDGNAHYPQKKALYVYKENDSIYSIYGRGNHLLLDSIDYIGLSRIAINEQDTFDLIEFITPCGDTLLYDAFLNESILPEQFKPHYEESIYWDFNYSNL